MTPSLSMRMIKPKPLKADPMRKAVMGVAQQAADAMAKDLTALTRFWTSGGVVFKGKVVSHRNDIEITAKPAAPNSKAVKIFGYLDQGTPKHPIVPKNRAFLKFQTGYKAGSRPNSTTVGKAKPASGPTRFSKGVMHPGIKARNWIKHTSNTWKRKIKKYGDAAMKAAAETSGHAYK